MTLLKTKDVSTMTFNKCVVRLMGDKRKNVYASSCEEIVTGEGLYLSYISAISPSLLIYLMTVELFTAEEVFCQKTLRY